MKISGVYQIKNKKTNEIYIGSSINLARREYEHFRLLKKNKHGNKHIQNSYNKYGENYFVFEILKICGTDECLKYEQQFINNLQPYYNINPTAGNSLNVKHSLETIEKIRKSKLGHITTNETKEKMSNRIKVMYKNGELRREKTEAEKIRARNNPNFKKQQKPIIQMTLNNEIIKEWGGCNEIMRELGYYAIHISRCCNGTRKKSYGYKWKYKK